MHTKLLPPFAACLRRAILGAIFLAAATHATEPATPPPDPAKQIKLEVRLLEMTPRQADLVEQTLLRWCADPSLQGPELDQILWGNAAKKVAELTGTAVSGQGWAKVENIREKKAVIPHGAPTGYAPAPTALRNLGEYLMFRGRLSTNGSYCDVDPGFQWNRMGEHKVNNFSFGSSFSTLQGLPLLLVRRDLAGSAELLVARVTWAAPVVKTWPSTERNTDKS